MPVNHTLIATAILTSVVSAQSWSQNFTQSPSMRRSGAMAFDPMTNKLLIHGGLTQTPGQALGDTWTYNGTWTQLTASAPDRWGHRMVRDAVSNHLLTFGGRSPTISSFNDDLMEWDGTSWTTVPTPVRPSPRYFYGMCYDTARTVMVLFGGRTQTGLSDETWEWNGVTWTQIPTANTPPAREEMVMEYEPTLHRVVLFGGLDGDDGTVFGDTWFYRGNDWLQLAPLASPTPRHRAAAAVDTRRNRIVLFGGFDGTNIVTDTYEFSGDSWDVIATGPNVPSNATGTYHGYDPVRSVYVVFGGFGGSFSNDTWEFTGISNGLFARFGSNCPTATSVPTLDADTPTIGQNLTFTFDGLQTSDEAVLVAMGFDNLVWQGLPLPLDLGILGLGGCLLNISADVLDVALSLGATSTTYSVPLPNQPALVNLPLFVQGLTLDLDSTSFLTGSTRGGRALIGN